MAGIRASPALGDWSPFSLRDWSPFFLSQPGLEDLCHTGRYWGATEESDLAPGLWALTSPGERPETLSKERSPLESPGIKQGCGQHTTPAGSGEWGRGGRGRGGEGRGRWRKGMASAASAGWVGEGWPGRGAARGMSLTC